MIETIDGRDQARKVGSKTARSAASTHVALRDLRVMADIGISPHEIGRRQPLLVSVALAVAPVHDDRIDATVDYRLVARMAEDLGAQRIALIETFARRLALLCLRLPGVREAEVRIDKPQALPAGIASVTIMLPRDMADAEVGSTEQAMIEEEV